MSDVKLTRQGVRDLNQLPGAKWSPNRSNDRPVHHRCSEHVKRILCLDCYYGLWWNSDACSCQDQCRICGRML
jgi:hypothetical protein